MKLLRILIFLFIITAFSCSNDAEETITELPIQGSIALALSNGAGFPVENIVATVSQPYGSSNTSTLTITGTAGATSESFFATIEYESDNFNLDGVAGTVIINQYTEVSGQKYTQLNATFSATGAGFVTITLSISDLILVCPGC